MKILYIHQYFNTPSMPGSTRSFEFAKKLADRGDKVHMITTNWQGKSNKKFSVENGINVYWGSIKYSNKMNFLKRLVSFVAFIFYAIRIGYKLDYDTIIATSTPLTVCIPALFLKKIKKTKLIFEVRDVWPQLPIALGVIKSNIVIKFLRFLELKMYKESDKIIALSVGMKKEILRVEKDETKISIITNLSDIDRFNINKKYGRDFRKNTLNIKNEPLILYAGSFGKINNVLYLVDIAKQSKDFNYQIKFLLIGNGFQKKLIEQRAKEYRILNDNLFIMNFLSKDELPKVLSASTVASSLFIDLPEMENNSANKFFDSLAAGKPIMINYQGWQLDLIREKNLGFFIPNKNPQEAIKIIHKNVSNLDLINTMAKNSKNLAKDYSVQKNSLLFQKNIDSLFKTDEKN